MKIKEIRDLSVDELKQKNKEFVEELFKLRFVIRPGNWILRPCWDS